MYFVRDLWPVWKGGRCHSMTWRWCWRAGGSQLVLLLGFLYMRVVLGSGCNDWQFIQKINWRTGGSPTRKHGNTETPTLSSIWYHATHPSLCDPRYVSMISPPSSHFLPFSPSLLSHVYFIHPDSHIRDGIHYWITPLSTTVQLSPHVSFNIWWICFKGREGGRTYMHTHTEMTSLVVGHCRAAPVISRTKRQVPELIQSGISYFRKKNITVSVCFYMHALK